MLQAMNKGWTKVGCKTQPQQCSECMILCSDKGIIDDEDGSFYCSGCWQCYVDGMTTVASVNRDRIFADGKEWASCLEGFTAYTGSADSPALLERCDAVMHELDELDELDTTRPLGPSAWLRR